MVNLKLGVGSLVETYDWSFACLITSVVTTIILSSNKIQNGDILAWKHSGTG